MTESVRNVAPLSFLFTASHGDIGYNLQKLAYCSIELTPLQRIAFGRKQAFLHLGAAEEQAFDFENVVFYSRTIDCLK